MKQIIHDIKMLEKHYTEEKVWEAIEEMKRVRPQKVNPERDKRKTWSGGVRAKKTMKLYMNQGGVCPPCGLKLEKAQAWHIDHIDPNRKDFNTDSNLTRVT